MFNDNDRGQVGIGTLIVFIAMVLVAAIAAGVLINTAGLLQSQAEATGEESSQQVVDRVQISSVSGISGTDGDGEGGTAEFDGLTEGEIDRIQLTTFRSPGADDIDLTNVIIEVFANGESGTLTHIGESEQNDDFDGSELNDPAGDEDDTTIGDGSEVFAIIDVQDADDGTLSDSGDRAQLRFDLSDISGDATLESGDTVSITVTTASGATAFVEKRAPSTIEDGQTYQL